MNRYDLFDVIFAHAFGWVYGLIRGLAELVVYVAQVAWVLIVRAFLSLVEWADGQWSDLGIADNPVWRMAVAAGVGFIGATFLILGVAGSVGHPELGCLFGLTVGFCAFVGLMADPDRDWSFPSFPGSGKTGGPRIPMNL